ncbi:sarcosine oxidase [Actinoplanes lutulentus]|uniref:Sarcosine oxidase n=1 Tax=Actinoplanes lutulentus TaxID=1287878 RepID=A0A327Z3H0_9ACTN|nr:FAD-dependent oxidoreductase [Actinoplanes lutulentus]MBB2947599.1 sarcosine oxidase [Actinoplanes lutulentus]RAK27655.1 sarcosine oxidase [Actinoplanes lutulentus]
MSRSFVVVGAGLTGAATAWRLAQRGESVTLLERATPANPQGSSHGSARIFRYAYPAAFYTNLVVAARSQWHCLTEAAGVELIRRTGSLDFGSLRDPVALAAILESAGVSHQLLAAQEAAARWPGINFDGPVLWHPDAGVLDASAAVHAMTSLAVEAGATVVTDWPVERIFRDNDGFVLSAANGDSLAADHVVLAAGGWLPTLLDELPSLRALMPPLRIRQEQAYHFPYRDHGVDWPTFIHKRDDIMTYSLPGGRDAGFRGQKLAEYNGGSGIASSAFNDGVVDPRNRKRVISYVERFLPGLDPTPYAETTCVFTMTPDEDFVIDTVDGITVASPCSGHGAKFAPLLGSLIADTATGAAPAPDRFRFRSRGVS